MKSISNEQAVRLTKFITESLLKLGYDVKVYLKEVKSGHNESEFTVVTSSFNQCPVIHKNIWLESKNSKITYISKKCLFKFSFDLQINYSGFNGSIGTVRDILTIKGSYKSGSNELNKVKAIINQL